MTQNQAIVSFKSWVFPSLVSLLGLMIWNDVNEIKADVKQLMAQSNIDKTRIDNLEREVFKVASSFPKKDDESKNHPTLQLAVLPNNKFDIEDEKVSL